ncbi:MAG: hypothetical protein GTO63_18840 [Anaerolineae bacterium]|nr:hypothetical protein [Anaerolineae bacterium]NIN96831.1 hypothetical protein [Anaerolineae bacterium]
MPLNSRWSRDALAATSRGWLDWPRQHLRTPLYGNAYYLMATSAVRSLSGPVFWVVAAQFYGPTDVGLGSATVSASLLLATLSSLGLGFGLMRFLPHAGDDRNDMVNSSFALLTLVSILAAAIFLIGLPTWSPALTVLRHHPYFVISFILFTGVATLSDVTDRVFIAHRAARFTFYKSAVASIFKLPLPLLFVGLSAGAGIAFSMWTPMILALAVSLLWFLPRLQQGYLPMPVLRKEVMSGLMRYSLANYGADLLRTVPTGLLPLMVIGILGAKSNAYFFAAWTVAQPLFMVSFAVSSSLFAEGSHDEQSLPRTVVKALQVTLPILILGVMLVFLIGDRLLLVFGQQYSQNATSVLRLLSLSALPIAVRAVGLTVYRVRKELRKVVVICALDASLTVALAYQLPRHLGLDGVGLGLLLAQLTVVAVMLCTELRRYRGRTGVPS